jgi:hypothetical protein
MGNCIINTEIPFNYGKFELALDDESHFILNKFINHAKFDKNTKIPHEPYQNTKHKVTCSYLHLAAMHDSVIFLEKWHMAKYPLNVLDSRGWTSLHWAVYYNSIHIFKRLIYMNADTNVTTKEYVKNKNKRLLGKTASEMAYILERGDIKNFLTRYKRDQCQTEIPIFLSNMNANMSDNREEIEIANRITYKINMYHYIIKNSYVYNLLYIYKNISVYQSKYGVYLYRIEDDVSVLEESYDAPNCIKILNNLKVVPYLEASRSENM